MVNLTDGQYLRAVLTEQHSQQFEIHDGSPVRAVRSEEPARAWMQASASGGSAQDGDLNPPRKFYAVVRGRQIGIFTSWNIVEPLVSGFPSARFKSFRRRSDAEVYLTYELSRLQRNG